MRARRVSLLGGRALLIMTMALLPAIALIAPAAASANLPPAKAKALVKLFRAELEPLGLRVSRGMLQSLDTYERDEDGTHLALYVEPTDATYTTAQYVKNFTKLTRLFIPSVFTRWKELESFDICQESLADAGKDAGKEAPPPVTQIFVTRDALDRVGRWRTATLRELLAASPRQQSTSAGYYVYFAPSIQDDPTLAAAAADAGWAMTTASTAVGH